MDTTMKKLLFILLILTFLTSPALADTIEPLFGFKTITDFPTDMKAGQTYQSECSFASTHDTSILINFTVSHPDINYDEWNAHFILNGTTMSFNESAPGHFTSNITSIVKGNHKLNISFSSLHNIVPGQYGYEFNLSSTQIEVTPTKKRRSSGGSTTAWPITTPTATVTPTPVPTPVPTAIPDLSKPTVSPTPEPVNITSAQTYITTDYRPHMMLGGMIFLLAAIITLISLGRRKKKAKAAAALKK